MGVGDRVRRAIQRAGREAAETARRAGTGRGNRGDTPALAESARKAAGQRKKDRAAKEAASTTQRRGSVATRMTVSGADIREAKTARQLDMMQRRIDELPDGMRKTAMQRMLDAQRKSFEDGQAAVAARASRKSAQSARDRKMKKNVTLPPMPFKKGGYVRCGASNPGTQKK